MIFTSKHRRLDLGSRVGVVAILNITPDSFYDGGKYADTDAVLARAQQCVADGADIIELGAESTNPTSKDLTATEEFARLRPALHTIRSRFPDAWISVDTYKAETAEQCISLGADMINDVTAGRGDDRMFSVIATHSVPIVLMYSKDSSARTTVRLQQYENVVATIHAFVEHRLDAALRAGVPREMIVVDPGLGHFISADPRYSFTVLDSLRSFTDLGPVLVSPSRKSFLAGPQNIPPSERLSATLKATETAARNGASFIRTHDTAETVALLRSLAS